MIERRRFAEDNRPNKQLEPFNGIICIQNYADRAKRREKYRASFIANGN